MVDVYDVYRDISIKFVARSLLCMWEPQASSSGPTNTYVNGSLIVWVWANFGSSVSVAFELNRWSALKHSTSH